MTEDHVTDHFTWAEAECHSDPPVPVPVERRQNVSSVCLELERVREEGGGWPLPVHRIYSTREHNESLPGHADHSMHLFGLAADVTPALKPDPSDPTGKRRIPVMTVRELFDVVLKVAQQPESRIRYIKHYPEHHVHFDLRPRTTIITEGV